MRRLPAAVLAAALCGTLLPAAARAQAPGTPAPPSQDPVVPVVRLASPQAPPGGETFVTLMLNNVPTEKIQTLKTEIEFQANHLLYVTARPGFAADLAGAKVDVTTRAVDASEPPLATALPVPGPPSPGPPRARTRIAISVTAKRPIPNGPVAELRFRVGPAFTVTHEGVAEKGDPAAAKPDAPLPPKPTPPPAAPGTPVPATGPDQSTTRTVIVRVAHRTEGANAEGTNVPLIAENGEVRITTERKGRVPVVFACFFYMH